MRTEATPCEAATPPPTEDRAPAAQRGSGDAPGGKRWRPLPRYILRKRNVLRAVRDRLDTIDDFLDVGCGAGDLACSLAELGLQGRALDFSGDAIAIAENMRQKRGIDSTQLRFEHSDATLAELRGRHDLVLSMEVLEHIEDDRAAFEDLVRLSDRYLMISVPAKRRLFGASDELAGHYRRYDRADLEALIEHEEMRVVQILNYGYPFTQLARIFLARGSRRALEARRARTKAAAPDSKPELSKTSGIHTFELSSLIKKLDLETWMSPAYHVSRLFNRSDLGEAYLAILERR